MEESLIITENIVKNYPLPKNKLFAKTQYITPVNKINLKVNRLRNLGIAGESGSGKSSLARVLGFIEKHDSGKLYFEGQEISLKNDLKAVRKNVQFVFQELYESLNPKRSIRQTLIEPLNIYKIKDYQWRITRVNFILEAVGLHPSDLEKYPHELSGGQRQRVAIARALMLEPKVIIADEPISALDVSLRSQILNLLLDLQKNFQITYIVISHDLSVLRFLCHEIVIYFAGQIVEYHKNCNDLFKQGGFHPYSSKLLKASLLKADKIDKPEEKQKEQIVYKNQLEKNFIGCRYYAFCPNRSARCLTEEPVLRSYKNSLVACHNPN